MPTVEPQQAAAAVETAFARSLELTNPFMTGQDVRRLQQLLTSGARGNFHPGEIDGKYGPLTAGAVARAKWTIGFPDPTVNGIAGPRLVGLLRGGPLPHDFQERAAAREHDRAKARTVRRHIVENARWGIANERQIHYRLLRPIDGLAKARKLPLYTDCSGFSTLCYAWAGAPDPNGNGYDGSGYTGTLLAHMQRIPPDAAQPGDLVVWGPPPGHHVAVVLQAGADPLLCSHGQEKGPLRIAFSTESRFQPSPATWLSCLP
jgi:peptidoglycan hydrolase-like protein with peptidoglycan-binding domain